MKQLFFYQILFLLFLLTASVLDAFSQMPIGEWRSHVSYHTINHITASENIIYSSSNSGLQLYYTTTGSVETLNSVNGLNDSDISDISYLQNDEGVLIGYSSGNLDYLKNNSIRNFPQVMQNAFYENKSINHILSFSDRILIATGFGIVEFFPDQEQFGGTFFPIEGSVVQVNNLAYYQGRIYAATQQGVYYADAENNLANPDNWILYTNVPNPGQSFNKIIFFNGQLILNHNSISGDDIVYHSNPQGGSSILVSNEGNVNQLAANQTGLFVAADVGLLEFNSSLSLSERLTDYPFGTMTPLDIFFSEDGQWWIGDANYGLVRKHSDNTYEQILRNSPLSDHAFRIFAHNETVYVTGGGFNENYASYNRNGMYYRFYDNTWESTSFSDFRDFTDLVVDPAGSQTVYIATWSEGLLVFQGGELVRNYTQDNSMLIPDNGNIKVHNLLTHENGHLLMINHGAEDPLKMKLNDGNWVSLDYDELKNRTIGGLIWAENAYVWGYFANSDQVFVIDFRGTLNQVDDDLVKVMEPRDHNGKTYAASIYTIEEDRDGNIWIATDEGVGVETEPRYIFENSILQPNRIRVTVDDYTQYLLRDNEVMDIYTDPANRKWFATKRSGVFLFSADGDNVVSHFTRENSPLLSNKVLTLDMNEKNGEIFFGTSKGIVSYRTNTAEAKSDFSQTYVFPNPVKPGYEGPITITNLVHGVNIKITDITGDLVYETVAEGGQAIWYGKTLNGQKVSTGVYLVFITNEDGSQTHIEKILFIK